MKAARSSVVQAWRSRRMAFVAAVWAGLLTGGPRAEDEPSPKRPALVPIRDVLADVNAPARRRVTVRGVVTWRGGNGLIVQDDSGGIWIDTPGDPPHPISFVGDQAVIDRIAPGLEIEVVGWTNRGGLISRRSSPATKSGSASSVRSRGSRSRSRGSPAWRRSGLCTRFSRWRSRPTARG